MLSNEKTYFFCVVNMGLRENVKNLIENSGLSIAAAAERSGVPQPRLNDIVLGKTKNPQLKTLQKLSSYFDVPVDELAGEGPIKNEQPAKAKADAMRLARERGLIDEAADSNVMVDIYAMADAGNGCEAQWHDPVDRRPIPPGFMKNGVRPVLVRGRSMEPTLRDGAVIGVDTNDRQVVDGEMFVVVLPVSGVVVKRIYGHNDGVTLRSDNSAEFPPVEIGREEVTDHFVVGRVRWVIQKF